MRVRLEWKPQDLWVGAFWKVSECWATDGMDDPFDDRTVPMVDLWICLIPMVPLHLTWQRRAR